MSGAIPRVSIGLPVYNGGPFLRAAIDSLLAQTCTDLELILCDNGSTDATEAICRSYAARDARVRYFRSEQNQGPARNYNLCFELSRGELFKWAAADDLVAPEFIEKCVARLDSDPSLVSVYTRTILIDECGQEIAKYHHELALDDPSPVVRFARMVFVNHRKHNAHEFWGVTRSAFLRSMPRKGSFPSADRILMSWWTLRGKMGRIEEYLFFNREHPRRSQRWTANRDFRAGSRLARWIGGGPTPPYPWWDPKTFGKIVFPEWRWVWEYLRAARCTPLPWKQKFACFGVMAGLYVKFLPRLARDLLIAAEMMLYKLFGRASWEFHPRSNPRPAQSHGESPARKRAA